MAEVVTRSEEVGSKLPRDLSFPRFTMDQLAAINKIVISVVATSIVIWFVNRKISERKHLPPTPLIGNTCQVPRAPPWITYSAWAKQYGIPMTNLGDATPCD